MGHKRTPRLTFRGAGDFNILAAAGWVEDVSTINKFGRTTNADAGIITDVHDGANATDDVAIWVAPTQARVHNIKSASGDDTSAGTGLKTLEAFGLPTWDTAEASQIITMNGTSDVATDSYVILHRLEGLTKGSGGTNAGLVTATAVTDGTVTAQINASQGQTQMAIYGIPSTQTLYMSGFYASLNRASGAAVLADIHLCYNPEPDVELTGFIIKHTFGLETGGTSMYYHRFDPPKKFVGPGIVKIQGTGSANNLDISAGFDAYLITN